MRNRLGKMFMLIGIVLMVAALSLIFSNHLQSQKAGQAALAALPQLQTDPPDEEEPAGGTACHETATTAPQISSEMPVMEIDGFGYIGYLRVPSLELELPVMDRWDYDRLRRAPCRFTGSVKTGDLTIAAHNYGSHFGKLEKLAVGDAVIFTDAEGTKYHYQVVRREELAATAVEEVTSGASDLVLFTCTYGGHSRVGVFCDQVEAE